jgi:hypothetical protein
MGLITPPGRQGFSSGVPAMTVSARVTVSRRGTYYAGSFEVMVRILLRL